jgi:hypothetical protein
MAHIKGNGTNPETFMSSYYTRDIPNPSTILISLFISSPLSTCHSLLQIQYLPLQNSDALSDSLSEADTLSDEITLYASAPKANETPMGDRLVKDEDGYFYSTDQLNPTWQVVPSNNGSIWELASSIISVQGLESLWSALGSETLIYYSSVWTEKALEWIISPHNAWNRIAVAIARSFILAPFDITQMKMIVQSRIPWYQTYTSTLNCLISLFSKVGFVNLYSSTSVLASVLETGVSSILYLGMITLIKRYKLGIMGMIGLSFLHVGILSPIETIRKRIQVSSFQDNDMKTIVQVPRIPWIGIRRTFYRMWHDEGALSLYRGFRRKWLITILGIYDLN